MTRQFLSDKKVRRIAKDTGLAIACALARGGTGHTLQLYLRDHRIVYLHSDGRIADHGERWRE